MRTILRAPNAQTVLLDIGGVRYPMTKGEDGVWTGVSNAQDEGFHYYQLNVDGVSVPDPGTQIFYGSSRWGSGVEIPAHDKDFYALKDVPHGQLREVHFVSKIGKATRSASSTPLPIMRRDRSAIRCSICNTAQVKMSTAGVGRGTPV